MKIASLLFLNVAVLSIIFGMPIYPFTDFCVAQNSLNVNKVVYSINSRFQVSGIFNSLDDSIPKMPAYLSNTVHNYLQNLTTTSILNLDYDNKKFSGAVDSNLTIQKTFVIDGTDSVRFNFSNATINGIYVEFPISIHSDDSIYAVDFSLKYNNSNVEFDSIYSLTNGLQYQYYLNPNDSILRFTSNRLSAIPNDSDLVILKFKTFNGQMCAPDIDSVHTYLNGDDCSYQLYGCIISGINEIAEMRSEISIFPNPTTTEFSYSDLGNSRIDEIKIFNDQGKLVQNETAEVNKTVNVETLSAGIYLIEFINNTTGDRKCVKLAKAGKRN